MDLTPLYVIGAGLVRSLVGWFKNSLQDGKIDNFEWQQLGATIVRVGLIGCVIAYFPGINISAFEASICAIGGDLVLEAVKKIKK